MVELSKLREIGLTEGELKAYTAILDLGECTKTALAKESGVSPSNIYDITNRLADKGMISRVEKNGVIHFSPANPSHILEFLERKKESIDKEKETVSSLLPLLLKKFSNAQDKTSVEVFEGWNGLQAVFDDLIDECKKGDENYVFGASVGQNSEQSDNFFLKYSRLRAEKGIVSKIIFNEEVKERKERIAFFKKSSKYKIRYMPQHTPVEIMVYKSRTVIIILTNSPLAIRLSGDESAESFKQYFEALWEQAKP